MDFAERVAQFETPDSTGVVLVKVTVTGDPEVAELPERVAQHGRRTHRGMVLGACLTLARAQLDRSITDSNEAALVAGALVIGVVLRNPQLEKMHTIDRSAGNGAVEDYRQLRANLQFLDDDRPPKVIMVTSDLPSKGKSTTVVNLGLALADMGRRVAIIEGPAASQGDAGPGPGRRSRPDQHPDGER